MPKNAAFLAGFLLSLGAAAGASAGKRPNILLVFADDHASQAISAYGSRLNRTPNIDRLAREGMLFRTSLVTNSICAPARAVILTGRYSHLNGVLDNRLPFDGAQQTFPKLLQTAGYQTAIVGKWHLKTDPTGFDHWEVLPGQGHYYNPDLRTAEGSTRYEGYVTDVITDLALEWLENGRDPARPFMLMYQHKAPHRNWMPGPAHLSLYDGVRMPEPYTLFDDYRDRARPAREQEMEIDQHMSLGSDLKVAPGEDEDHYEGYVRTHGRLTPAQKRVWDAAYEPKNAAFRAAGLEGRDLVRWKYQRYIKDYLRTIASIDDNLGRVLRWLDETGLAESTVVVYSSDQGFYLGEHGWFDKRWMYEESLRTPLVVRWPGVVARGVESDAMVSNLDLPETFLEIAGVTVPDDMQGRSLVSIFRDRGHAPWDWRKSFYYHYYAGPEGAHAVARHDGVRTDRHKLIHYYETDEWELFDLETDPLEMRSVHGTADYAKLEAELRSELARLRKDLRVTVD